MKTGIRFLNFPALVFVLFLTGCTQDYTSEENLEKINLNASTPTCKEDSPIMELERWKEKGESGDSRSACDRIGASDCAYSAKFEGSDIFGYHEIELGGITITQNPDGTISWESHGAVKICRVMLKAGQGANVYGYSCEDFCGSNLMTPDGKEISHISICYRDRSVHCPS